MSKPISKQTKRPTNSRSRPRKSLFKIDQVPEKKRVEWTLNSHVLKMTEHYRDFIAATAGIRPNEEDVCTQAMLFFFGKDRLFVQYMESKKATNDDPLGVISDSGFASGLESLVDNMPESSPNDIAAKIRAKPGAGASQTPPLNGPPITRFSPTERSRLNPTLPPKHEQQQEDLLP